MAKKPEPPVVIRNFRADGVTQFEHIPREPEVLEVLRAAFDIAARAAAKTTRRQQA